MAGLTEPKNLLAILSLIWQLLANKLGANFDVELNYLQYGSLSTLEYLDRRFAYLFHVMAHGACLDRDECLHR